MARPWRNRRCHDAAGGIGDNCRAAASCSRMRSWRRRPENSCASAKCRNIGALARSEISYHAHAARNRRERLHRNHGRAFLTHKACQCAGGYEAGRNNTINQRYRRPPSSSARSAYLSWQSAASCCRVGQSPISAVAARGKAEKLHGPVVFRHVNHDSEAWHVGAFDNISCTVRQVARYTL